MTRTGALAAGAVLAVGASGCESTQDQSARLKAAGAQAFKDTGGLSITARARGVKVVQRAVIADANGTAVALVLRNAGATPLRDVPIAIDLRGVKGRSVFRNDAPGLEPSLTSVGVLAPRGETTWVDDQVTPDAPARTVRAVVGAPKHARAAAAPRVPHVVLEDVRVVQDPSSGAEITGWAKLRAGAEQRNLIVYCLARRGRRIVAAGRAEIPRLTRAKRQRFHVFPIGNPRGARLALSAPPTVL